jgi:hypothetical protein
MSKYSVNQTVLGKKRQLMGALKQTCYEVEVQP